MKKIAIILTALVSLQACSYLADSLIYPNRQPIIKTPADYGMKYQNIEFTSLDSINLKAWLIPTESEKLIIFTHPMNFTRYGYSVKHQKPFKITKLEVEFLNVVKVLHNEGYNVLMFDFRNHGESASSENRMTGVGLYEWQDIAGAVQYIKSNPDLSNMQMGFVSNCMGANSTIIAFSKANEIMKDFKCLVAIQPISSDVFTYSFMQCEYALMSGITPGIEKKFNKKHEFTMRDISPIPYIQDLNLPVLYTQVTDDCWTDTSQIRKFYNLTQSEKELYWITGEEERFDGYNYFAHNPAKLLEFLNRHFD